MPGLWTLLMFAGTLPFEVTICFMVLHVSKARCCWKFGALSTCCEQCRK
jgi:hypothetical protein